VRKTPNAICGWALGALLGFAGSTWAADAPVADTHASTTDIAGTYELVKRVMSDGKEILPPAIEALYSMNHGRGNFNLFVREKDGKVASESTISRYTLTASEYCGSCSRRETISTSLASAMSHRRSRITPVQSR